ncbi:unnamed protein product [Staurois parvus]|uniref:Uncharacterized protein n=1 Tax=Staurois parvus TaxID=386267 RepID=A0ABN9BNX4_9NEOB|nr:unnamed protein product [Staurois parvus]
MSPARRNLLHWGRCNSNIYTEVLNLPQSTSKYVDIASCVSGISLLFLL